MRLLIIGTGMYVTGRYNTGAGTILASIFETSRIINFEEIVLTSRNKLGEKDVLEATNRLNSTLKTKCSTKFIALGYDDLTVLENLLKEERFDACIISTPDHLHYKHARLCIKANLHTLIVKPFTPTTKEGKELIQLQESHNIYGAVEFHKRWDKTNMYIKRRLSEGAFGKPLYMSVEYSQRITIPTETFSSWVNDTNIFQYLGVHYVDLVYYLTGYLPEKVLAIGTNGILKEKGIDAYDSIHVDIIWKNPQNPEQEFFVHYDTNWIDPTHTTAMSDQKYRLVGTKGRIDCNQKNRGLEEVTETEGVRSVNPYFSDFLPDGTGNLHFDGYGHRSISSFLQDVHLLLSNQITIEKLEQQRPTFKHSLISTAVVEAVNKSLENNAQWTKIPPLTFM